MSEIGFDNGKFVESFPVIAEAEGGIERLRRVVVELAMKGWLLHEDIGRRDRSLPAGWSTLPLSQCVEVLDARRIPINDEERTRRTTGKSAEDLFPYYGATRQQGWIDDYLFDEDLVLLGEDGVLFFDPFRPKAYRVSGKCWVNNHAHVLRPTATTASWLCHALNVADYSERATGTTRLKLTQGQMLDIPLSVPPLPEQKRIVAKVDELMRLIDDLEAKRGRKQGVQEKWRRAALDSVTQAEESHEILAAWERMAGGWAAASETPDMVGDLRCRILALAVTGRLSVESLKVRSWRRLPLGTVADSRLGKMLDKAKNQGTPMPYLRNTNVHWFSVHLDTIKTMPFGTGELNEYALRAGDVLVCEGGHGIGRTAVWMGQRSPMMFQKALHRLRPCPWMDSFFLAYQIKVAADSGVLEEYFTGAGIPHLTGRSLARLEIVVPPLAEQKRIVARVDQLMALCDALEAALRRKEQLASKLAAAVVAEMVA